MCIYAPMNARDCFTVRTLMNLRDSIAADKTSNSTSFNMSCRLNDAAKIQTFLDMMKNILPYE